MELSRAVVLPLAISTATAALFDGLRLSLPTIQPASRSEYVLIWGGSSSVGCVAIQLARAAGYHVVATASNKNHELASALGASRVFDYADPNVVRTVVDFLLGGRVAGAFDCIGHADTSRKCADILDKLGGGSLITVLVPPSDLPSSVKVDMGT